jgi:gentisate 1,2-dioxygenase
VILPKACANQAAKAYQEEKMAAVSPQEFERAANMEELLALLAKAGIENGWAKREPSMYAKPKKAFVPARWSGKQARAALDAAGRFVNTELAERRNLILNNPVPGNFYPTVTTLVAAYQMVRSGELARSHRHTANALRFVLDTKPGMYTIVGGKKIPMEPNDVLLTPNWCWHGHANESPADGYWIDFLDVPLTHLLGPMFFEHHEEKVEKTDIIDPNSPARFAFTETVRRLEAEKDIGPGHREIKLGDPALTTIALSVVRLEAGASFTMKPSTLSCIYAVMQGTGSAQIDEASFTFERGDVLAAPSSAAQRFEAKEQCYLLRVTDEPLLRFLGWLRDIEQ